MVGLKDRLKRRTKAAGLDGENLIARAEGKEQMSVNYTLAAGLPGRSLAQVVDEW